MPLPGETAYSATNEASASRLTTFFRYFCSIPHAVVGALWGFAAYFATIIAWFALLFTGRYPQGLYDFNAGFVRFLARYQAYSLVAVSQYPPFDGGEHPEYPVVFQIGPPKASYSRALVFFRIIPLIAVYFIGFFIAIFLYLLAVVAWFAVLFTGKLPDGVHGAMSFCLGYIMRAACYFLLLTEAFPGFANEPADQAPTTPTTGVAGF
ncbi:DUF4389 domain-containing protein [Patulibacter minatonensis]|uniref:DUF4389 domain-containing protein n=1 Tax=Patulibacter minatonensis TaxID=298163 RepID=UPI00047B659F|nr:DUF4389 domain-containing protein [Patulibacter minatonensis]